MDTNNLNNNKTKGGLLTYVMLHAIYNQGNNVEKFIVHHPRPKSVDVVLGKTSKHCAQQLLEIYKLNK